MKEMQLLTVEELDPLFKDFLSFDRILLAVSGGSDSLALLYLASEWVKKHPQKAPILEVATIDHGLRDGSLEEAFRVRTHAEALGFRHHLLPWRGLKPQTSLQALARTERYTLFENLALTWKNQNVAIATAHTLDDQAETVLMRLARASGPDGLKGITQSRPLHASSRITLLRPLLDVSRKDLRAWLLAHHLSWEEDPSNLDTRFERVRIRNAIPSLHSLGLYADKLALAAKRQQRAVHALEEATSDLQRKCLHVHGGAYGRLDVSIFGKASEELRVRLLARLLNLFRGETPPAQLEQVECLAADLQAISSLRRTLGGCEIHLKKKSILIYREVGRASLPTIPLQPGVPIVWDQRFRILLAEPLNKKRTTISEPSFLVCPVDPKIYRCLRGNVPERVNIPARAAATLPAVWSGEKLIKICGMGSEESVTPPFFPLTDHPIHAEFLNGLRFETGREHPPSFTSNV